MLRCAARRGRASAGALGAAVRGRAGASTLGETELPLSTGRPRLVVLGTGWGGARIARDISCDLYDLTIISPRNHMVFTPLLAATTVGTLELQSVVEHVRHLQPALRRPQNHFYISKATAVDAERKVVTYRAHDGLEFELGYDKLAIATGAAGSTFGIPGVREYALPLRDARDAAAVRDKLLGIVSLANTPTRRVQDRIKLLSVVIVGGGPTGVEFAGELASFIREDLAKFNPDVGAGMKVTLVEGNELLGSFDHTLRTYAASRLMHAGVHLVKGTVERVTPSSVELKDGSSLPFGMLVWSTGVGPTTFTRSMPFVRGTSGRLAVDGRLNVTDAKGGGLLADVFALGDCATNEAEPLPPLAQVAEQQGKFVAKLLNDDAKGEDVSEREFSYRHLGAMAALTTGEAVIEVGRDKRFTMTGLLSFLAWRSAYLTRLGTWRSRIHVAIDWFTTLCLGRDMSRVGVRAAADVERARATPPPPR